MDDPALVPADPDAERRIIGSIMLQPSLIAEAMGKISPTDFYQKHWSRAYNACCDLFMASKPVNIDTVIRRLDEIRTGGRSALEDMGGTITMTESIEGVLPEEIDFWLDRVATKAMEREAFYAVNDLRRKLVAGGADVRKLLSEHEERLAQVARGRGADEHGTVSMAQANVSMQERLDRYAADPDSITGIPSGYRLMDRYLDGFQSGGVYMFYAPTSRYKSLIVTAIGLGMARNGASGHWFTTEMPHVQVQERLLQLEAGVNIRWSRRDGTLTQKRGMLDRAAAKLERYAITICDRSVDISMVRADVIRRKKWEAIDYIIIDMVDQVSTAQYKDNSVAQQEAVMRALKELAKDADIPVLCTSHVAKADRALRGAASIDIMEMKGSSAKGQDADAAISLMVVEWDNENGGWYGLTRDEIKARNRPELGGRLKVLAAIHKNRQGDLEDILFEIDWSQGGRLHELNAERWHQSQFDDTHAWQ